MLCRSLRKQADFFCFSLRRQRVIKNTFHGFSIPARAATIYSGGDKPVSYTLLSTVGRAVAAVLAHPLETTNCYVYIHSVRCTQNDILAALETVTGEKWKRTERLAEEARRSGLQRMKRGDMSGMPDVIVGGMFMGVKEAEDEGKA